MGFPKELVITLVTGLVLLFGLGTLPILPGLVIMWIALGVYGLVLGFGPVGVWIFALETVLMLIGVFIDNIIIGAKAKADGATWTSLGAAGLAALIGTVVIPVPILGGLAAAFAVLFLAEYLRWRDVNQAWQTTRGLLIGWGWAFAARFAIGLVMIGLWLIWAWTGLRVEDASALFFAAQQATEQVTGLLDGAGVLERGLDLLGDGAG